MTFFGKIEVRTISLKEFAQKWNFEKFLKGKSEKMLWEILEYFVFLFPTMRDHCAGEWGQTEWMTKRRLNYKRWARKSSNLMQQLKEEQHVIYICKI